MNKKRLSQIEERVKEATTPKNYYPWVAWLERGYLYIPKTPFLVERLESLGREVEVAPWMSSNMIKIDPEDREIVKDISEDYLTLVGMDKPIKYLTIVWVSGNSNN